MEHSRNKDIPVTLLAGFLGSGKTTLLNNILSQDHGRRIAVIENEFGEISVDHDLVIGADDDIFEMSNGCICCSIKGDLVQTLNRLLERQDKFEYILIEATGLASPGPIAQAFLVDQEIDQGLKLDGVVTLVDGKHIWNHLDELDVAWEQIAFSNVIVLNKIDLIEPQEIQRIETRIREINPIAKLIQAENAEVPLDSILDIGGFELDSVSAHGVHVSHEDDSHSDHSHGESVEDAIASVGLTLPGHVDPHRFNLWLQMLLITDGMDVFRAKGFLNVRDSAERFVFQSVYMMFDSKPEKLWGDRPRENTLLFIGRNLDRDRLRAGVESCMI